MSTAFALIAERLGKLIPRLGSDQPGEVAATVAAIGRTLARAGLDWHDLARRAATPSIMDAFGVPTPEPSPAPSPPPPTSSKSKREPSPWPTWSTLSHFGRLAMMKEIKVHGRFKRAEAEEFAAFYRVYYTQQCGATRKTTIFSTGPAEIYVNVGGDQKQRSSTPNPHWYRRDRTRHNGR